SPSSSCIIVMDLFLISSYLSKERFSASNISFSVTSNIIPSILDFPHPTSETPINKVVNVIKKFLFIISSPLHYILGIKFILSHVHNFPHYTRRAHLNFSRQECLF